MSSCYIPGTDPLAPMPLTADQIHDLIARARLSSRATSKQRARTAGASRRLAALRSQQRSTIGRIGARYAMLTNCSMAIAARVMREVTSAADGIVGDQIRNHWRHLYPGVSTAVARRPALISAAQ